jgi:hypothetical protein
MSVSGGRRAEDISFALASKDDKMACTPQLAKTVTASGK